MLCWRPERTFGLNFDLGLQPCFSPSARAASERCAGCSLVATKSTR